MEGVGIFFVVSVLVGLVLRLSSERGRTKRRGPRVPARFVRFIGRRFKITTQRTDALNQSGGGRCER